MEVKLLGSFLDENFDYAAAMHNGYCRLLEPVIHYRTVLFVHPSHWIIIDRVEGNGKGIVSNSTSQCVTGGSTAKVRSGTWVGQNELIVDTNQYTERVGVTMGRVGP